jgi:hypothetical protein
VAGVCESTTNFVACIDKDFADFVSREILLDDFGRGASAACRGDRWLAGGGLCWWCHGESRSLERHGAQMRSVVVDLRWTALSLLEVPELRAALILK